MISFALRFRLHLILCLITSLGLASAQTVQIRTEIETRPGFYYYSSNSFSVAADKSNLRLVKEPVYQSDQPRYQKLIIGNHEKKKYIAVVIDEAEGRPPRIYIDANNNGDLTDDGDPVWANESDAAFRKEVTIRATFMIEGKEREVGLPYLLMRIKGEERRRNNGGDVIIYSARYGRSGTVKLQGKDYLVSVKTTNQGLYPLPEKQTFLIDLNHDGKLDRSALSAELFPGTEPFNIDGESYRVAGASETGDQITLEVSPVKAAPRHHIVAGEPAPDFTFTTIDGKKLKLSDLKGKFVLLDFWATWCGPCIAGFPHIRKMYDQFDRSKFEVIGVSIDGEAAHPAAQADVARFIPESPITWPVTFDEGGTRIARLFNITGIPVYILIDPQGVIRLALISGGEEAIEKIRAAVAKPGGN
jgi:peroxiredoxin